jgi:hypothetical protein
MTEDSIDRLVGQLEDAAYAAAMGLDLEHAREVAALAIQAGSLGADRALDRGEPATARDYAALRDAGLGLRQLASRRNHQRMASMLGGRLRTASRLGLKVHSKVADLPLLRVT